MNSLSIGTGMLNKKHLIINYAPKLLKDFLNSSNLLVH
jgi:hypothetical protein